MDKFILNVIHRPELVPEYIDTGSQEGEAVALAKEHHEKYGDEIGHTFLGVNCKEFREFYNSKEIAIWLFPMDMKKKIVDHSFKRFKEVFGFYPTSTGSYFMDAELIAYIKSKYPGIQTAVATCFEEGPKVFRHANNSWYTIMDGSPWTAWVPSKCNTHAIAESEEDDLGIVAVPHLSRDLLAIMDNPGDMFGTHPQNIIRGLIYEGDRLPYMYNLIDQYQVMKKYNRGFSYNLVYVGPGWMGKAGRWECDYRVLKKSYEDFMAYYGQLKREGKIEDMTMTEFAGWFRRNQPRSGPVCGLWKDVLYGTKNQAFWYVDSKFRVQVDLKQGGAITDLRPYVSKMVRPCGAGTACNQDASYPYLVQSRYRAGAFVHYAGEGAIKSAKVRHDGEEIDLSSCRSTGVYEEDGDVRVLKIRPVEVDFKDGLKVKIETVYRFPPNTGEIEIARRVIESSDPAAKVVIDEFLTACWGTNEYPEDLTGCILMIEGADGAKESIFYDYRCREAEMTGTVSASAVLAPDPDARGADPE